MRKFLKIMVYIVGYSLILFPLILIAAGQSRAADISENQCVVPRYTEHSVCEYPAGHYLHYTVGYMPGGEVSLAGEKIPDDKSLDGMPFSVHGRLIIQNSCTILVVDYIEPCPK